MSIGFDRVTYTYADLFNLMDASPEYILPLETEMESPSLPRSIPSWSLIPVFLCILCDFAGGLLWAEGFSITQENALLENSQVFFLALAVFLSIRQVSYEENKTVRISHAVLGMLFLSIVIREVDINRLGSAAIWEAAELVIRLGAVVVWLYLGALVFRKWKTLWRIRFSILFSPTSFLTAVGILFYMISWHFDKSASPNQEWNRLWEELLQLNGTIFFFAASFRPLPLHDPAPMPGNDLREKG